MFIAAFASFSAKKLVGKTLMLCLENQNILKQNTTTAGPWRV